MADHTEVEEEPIQDGEIGELIEYAMGYATQLSDAGAAPHDTYVGLWDCFRDDDAHYHVQIIVTREPNRTVC